MNPYEKRGLIMLTKVNTQTRDFSLKEKRLYLKGNTQNKLNKLTAEKK